MEFGLVGILITVLAASRNLHAEHIDLGNVIFANVLFRHGDRTPVDPYPNDPYNDESLWPVPFGQLTTLGQHEHLLLGRWLRNRYENLLSDTYSLHDVYVMSTDFDRTLMSAEANLAGLYPPHGKQIWDSDIKWMPIPVHTVPLTQDHLLAGKKYCPRYDHEMNKVLQSPEMKRIQKENSQLFDYISKKSGRKIDGLQNLEYLYNTLWIESRYNKTLPPWTQSVYPEKMEPLARFSFRLQAYNKILQRLKSGPLLGEIIEHMKEKSKNAMVPDRKVWMYSAHDDTIANFLMTLNIFDTHCPPYAAAVLLELREDPKGKHVVTVFYKNTTDEPKLLTIPGCLAACPLQDFIKLTKSVVPENWEKECLMDASMYGYNVSNSAIIAILSWSVLFLVVLILLIFGFIYSQHRRENSQYYLRLSTDPI
ncbi:lysosomal acid phosphatase-like [Venturia canescens]|uniref:lysosomal acid phosphatase-like n=1 Tax=Venturia canescens TaxID=32260 RepID=UPI001C9CE2F3|nr:lysosomal acid phosphatase-like [Venturia canescens]